MSVLKIHINGFIWYILICFCFFCSISINPYYSAYQNFILFNRCIIFYIWIEHLIYFPVERFLSFFWFGNMNKAIANILLHTILRTYTYMSFGYIAAVDLLSHNVGICLALVNTASFPKSYSQFKQPLTVNESSRSFISLSIINIVNLFNFNPGRCNMYLYKEELICIYLLIVAVEYVLYAFWRFGYFLLSIPIHCNFFLLGCLDFPLIPEEYFPSI